MRAQPRPVTADNAPVYAHRFLRRLRWRGEHLLCDHEQFRLGRAVLYPRQVAWLMSGRALTEGMQVVRSCGNARCVRPSHLNLLTPAQASPGPQPKLTALAVRWIRRRRRWEYGDVKLYAEALGVHPHTISRLRTPSGRRTTWRGVE
jgi:hypothetical protein